MMSKDRQIKRLIARRDIEGPEWMFVRGQRLLGRKGRDLWTVWPRRDPGAYICCVGSDYVKVVGDET